MPLDYKHCIEIKRLCSLQPSYNNSLVKHIEVTIPKVETTEQLGNTNESNYNWLTIGPSIYIDDFMITNKVSHLNVTIKIPPESNLPSDSFHITASSNDSSVKLSPTIKKFIPREEGIHFFTTILLEDDDIYPLQEFPITFKLYKNNIKLYQSITYCFYGGLPNITMKTSFASELMPGMNLSLEITIDQSDMITSNVSICVQIKFPLTNQLPYLKYQSHQIYSSSGSEVQNNQLLQSTFNDGNEDMIYIEMLGRPDKKDIISLEINATVLENPSLNNTPQKYPISVAVVIGPYMAYFDEKNFYFKIDSTETLQNDTESKQTKIKMEVEANIISFSKDDVNIKIVVEHDTLRSAPITNPNILLYRVPFITYRDFNISSSIPFQSHEKYRQLWKFPGKLLPTQRIFIDQNGTILQKYLLKEGLNELYILVTISFENQSGDIVRMDKLAPLFLYKKPMVIVPLHFKRLPEYYGIGFFFDERENGLNLIACMNQHKTSSEVACFYSNNYGVTWKEMDLQLSCIIGYTHDGTGLVGISRNQQYYIHYRAESRCYAPYEGDKTHFGKAVVLEDAEYVKMDNTANVKEHHKKVYKGNHEFAGTIHGLYYRNDKDGDWLLRMKWRINGEEKK